MSKSIEEQAEEYAGKRYDKYLGTHISESWSITKANYLAGAKARDAQLMIVVNEYRSIILSQPRYTENNQLEIVETESFKTAMNRLTKADQMLKEMGMK